MTGAVKKLQREVNAKASTSLFLYPSTAAIQIMYKVLALIINQLVNIAEIFENAQRAFERLGKGSSPKVLQPVTSLSAKGTDNH